MGGRRCRPPPSMPEPPPGRSRAGLQESTVKDDLEPRKTRPEAAGIAGGRLTCLLSAEVVLRVALRIRVQEHDLEAKISPATALTLQAGIAIGVYDVPRPRRGRRGRNGLVVLLCTECNWKSGDTGVFIAGKRKTPHAVSVSDKVYTAALVKTSFLHALTFIIQYLTHIFHTVF